MTNEIITSINRVELISKKTGKPFTSLRLKVASRGDKLISGFGNKSNSDWRVGDSVAILIEEKGEYLNFTMAESKKGEELANNMKIDQVYSVALNIQTMVMELCKDKGIKTGFEDIQKARADHNSQSKPVSDGYSSKGADGEPSINASSVDFLTYPLDDINPDDIPF